MGNYIRPQWIEQGPGPLALPVGSYNKAAGAIQSLATDPTDPERVYVATVGGGIWLSTNAASTRDPTWVPLTDLAPSLSMTAIAFCPLDPNHNTLFAGSGLSSHSAPQVGQNGGPLFGLLKTIDGGITWIELARNIFQNQSVWKILPLPLTTKQGSVVLVGTDKGLYRSVDGGTNWAIVASIKPPVTDIVEEPGNPTRIYVAAGGHISRSEDGGDKNWTDVTPNPWNQIPNYTIIALDIGPATDAHGNYWIYAAATGINDGSSLIFSQDLGATWTQTGKTPDGQNPSPPIAASPSRPDAVFCLTDGGTHWMAVTTAGNVGAQWFQVEGAGANGTGPHTDARGLQFSADPNLLFEVDDGGIYRLVNPHGVPTMPLPFQLPLPLPFGMQPRHWEEAVGNIRIAEFQSISYDSVNHILFGATQDNSIPQQTVPGNIAWGINEWAWGDGFQVGVDNKSTPGVAIHYSSQQSLFKFVRRAYASPTNVLSSQGIPFVIAGTGGLQYNQVEGAIRDDGSLGTIRWNQSWIVNSVDPTRLLLGSSYLYESFDRGDTAVSLGGLTKNGKNEWIPDKPVGVVTAYAYGHVNNPDVIYVGAAGNLLLRTSNTGLPSVIGRKNPGDQNDPGTYPGSSPVGIALYWSDWRIAYVLDDQGRVWRTSDAGATNKGWANITGNLPQLSSDLRTIEVMPPPKVGEKEVIFVGGYGGVFVTENPGDGRFAFWRKHGTNMPNAVTVDVYYNGDDDILIAGTLGRAAWSLNQCSQTLVGEPTLRIHASVKRSCFGGWVENTTVLFTPDIQSLANLVKPLLYEWELQGASTNSPLDGLNLQVDMPGAGNEVSVTLTVTDATGYKMFAFINDQTITADLAALRFELCALQARLRSIGIIRLPLIPPPEHRPWPDPGPEFQLAENTLSPQIYPEIRELSSQMVVIAERLIRAETRSIVRPAKASKSPKYGVS